MSDSGKTQRPGAPVQAPTVPGPPSALPTIFRSVDPSKSLGPARFDGIREERQAAATQIQRTMKAWRVASGAAGQAGVPKGSGAPLPSTVRSKMEPKLGASLGSVRVHTGGESAEAAKGFGARAFTVGEDVHFNSGEFQPGTKEGDKLLAHELTHVVQGQKSGVQRMPEHEDGGDEHKDGEKGGAEVSDPNEPAEKEADATGEKVGEELHGGDEKKDAKGGKDKKGGDKKDTKGEHGEKEEGAEGKEDGDGKEGGGGKEGGDEKGEAKGNEKAAPIAAKLEGIGLKIFRALKYAPSPKHAKGGWGTPMDLNDAVAQQLLDSSILSGKQRYNYLNGKLYEFQPDNAGGWHGYPIPGTEAPAEVLKALRDQGKVTPAEYKKLVKGK